MSESNFNDSFRNQAAKQPEAPAIQFKEQRLSYAQLAQRMESFRAEWGSVEGLRVIILLPDSLETYLFYLFLFLGKAVLIPMSVQSTGPRLKSVIDAVQPHLVVTNELLLRTHLDVLNALPCLEVGEPDAAVPCGFKHKLHGPAKSVPDIQNRPAPGAEKVRFIIFTSGSTGVPKGVCLSERNIVSAAEMMVDFLGMTPATRTLVTVPLYDYYGLIQIFAHILSGASYLFGNNPAFLKQFHQALEREKVTDLALVPHTLRKLTEASPEIAKQGMGALKRITTSSDILTEDILNRAFQVCPDVVVVNIYGLTEAGRACTRKISRTTVFSKSIGRPSKGVELVIEGEAGQPGEIILRGPNVMLGYFQHITDHRVEFKPYTEMRTGDLGYYDATGEVVLLGRRDHMFNLMGAKIHPTEIEMAALSVGGIVEAMARVATADDGKPVIHLDVVFGENAPAMETLMEALRKTLPRMFVPAVVKPVPQLARTELGAKIIRPKS